jgi:WS/DGAT/MGAT family acyltransferase
VGEDPPTPFELLTRASLNNALQPFRFAEVMARTVPALGRLGALMSNPERPRALPVPRTRFNRAIGAHRVVEGRKFDLAEVRAIKSTIKGATVNDVILTVVGGALRKYLAAKNEVPAEPLVAMAPISVRSQGERNSMGNQVAAMNVALGTHIADPIERLTSVHESAASSKEMTNAIGAKLMTDYSRFIPSTTAALATRLYTQLGMAERIAPPFNCVVTNVPGPQVPLYSTGARLVTQYGLGPVFDGMGLIFPVFSYCGHITVSFTSCRDMLPDPEFLAECLQESFEELRDATVPATQRTASVA